MTNLQLARMRRRLGLTKSEMAEMLKVDPATITRWEAGTVTIPGICVLAIECVLGQLKEELGAK